MESIQKMILVDHGVLANMKENNNQQLPLVKVVSELFTDKQSFPPH